MANKVWRAAFIGHHNDNAEVVTVFHVKDSTPLEPDLRTPGQMADIVDTWLTTLYLNCAVAQTTLDEIKITSEVEWWNNEIAEQHVKTKGVTGNRAGSDGKLPKGVCGWSKAVISEVFRGNHGGWHTPPQTSSTEMASTGEWNQAANVWPSMGALNTALLAGSDYMAGLGHVSYILYSTTRRRRGDANYYFDVTGLIRDVRPHFLRTRLTSP